MLKKQTEHYFENHKDLEEDKWVKIEGWGSAEEARKEIMSSLARYQALENTAA